MSEKISTAFGSGTPAFRGVPLFLRSMAGGALMGLANLVPGVSGGTMLLAVGLYPQFIAGVAEVSTPEAPAAGVADDSPASAAPPRSRSPLARRRSAPCWTAIRGSCTSLFIGLAAGGIPISSGGWCGRWNRTVALSAAVAVAAMALLAVLDPERVSGAGAPGPAAYVVLVVAGVSGGAAMILPGVSGAYLLLVLGQYRPIVDAVAAAVDIARAGAWDTAGPVLHVLVPVALGVVTGVAVVSNLVRLLLATRRRATLGFLLGLLLGAVIGLWPFTEPVRPRVGDIVRGQAILSPAMVEKIAPADYRRERTLPSAGQAGGAALLVLAGFGASWSVSRLGA